MRRTGFNVQIARQDGHQIVQIVRLEEAQTPRAEFGEIARIDAKAFEGATAFRAGSGGHRRVRCAGVHVNRVEQKRRALRVGVEPTLEGDLLEMFGASGARLDLRLVHVGDVSLLPVVRGGADRRMSRRWAASMFDVSLKPPMKA
jgi:hypothetical protein